MKYNSQYLNQEQEDKVNKFLDILATKDLSAFDKATTGTLSKHAKVGTIMQLILWERVARSVQFTDSEARYVQSFLDVIEEELEQIANGTQEARSERLKGE